MLRTPLNETLKLPDGLVVDKFYRRWFRSQSRSFANAVVNEFVYENIKRESRVATAGRDY